jgi:chromosomal replication initiator protein
MTLHRARILRKILNPSEVSVMSELDQAYARARHKFNGHIPSEKPQDDRLSITLRRIEARLDDINAKLSTLLTPLITTTAQVPRPGNSQPKVQPRPYMRQIIAAVCEAYQVNDTDLLSERRGQPIAFYRQIAMYLCCRLTFHGLPTIGRVFKRDHTTVLYARDSIAQKRNNDEKLRSELAALEAQLWPQQD